MKVLCLKGLCNVNLLEIRSKALFQKGCTQFTRVRTCTEADSAATNVLPLVSPSQPAPQLSQRCGMESLTLPNGCWWQVLLRTPGICLHHPGNQCPFTRACLPEPPCLRKPEPTCTPAHQTRSRGVEWSPSHSPILTGGVTCLAFPASAYFTLQISAWRCV